MRRSAHWESSPLPIHVAESNRRSQRVVQLLLSTQFVARRAVLPRHNFRQERKT